MLKWIYEHAFANWLHSKGSGKEVNKWFTHVAQATTQRAQENDDALSIAEKVLKRLGNDPISPAKFMSELISETQKLSGSQTEKQDNVKAAKALENFKLDWFVKAFEKFINNDQQTELKRLLQRQANGNEPMIGEGLKAEEKLNFTVIQESLQANLEAPTDDQKETEQKAYIYYVLHLMTNDAVSLLRHQLQKWWILYNQWQKDPAFKQGEFYIDKQQTKLYRRWTAVMDLYLLIQQAQFLRQGQATGNMKTLPSWVYDRYEADEHGKKDYVNDLFHQGSHTLIPYRHLRLLERYGYAQIHQLLQKNNAPTISHTHHVHPWLTRDENALAQAHAYKEELHQAWVKHSENPSDEKALTDAQIEHYKQVISIISAAKQQQSAVLLQDEFKRYQLLINILGRLVDYASLWERDVVFICCALLHQLHQTQPNVLTPIASMKEKDRKKSLNEGELSSLVDQVIEKSDLNATPTITALYAALKRMGYKKPSERANGCKMSKYKDTRNQLAHFGMLHPKQDKLSLSSLIDTTRELMSYDRKLKNAVSYSIIDMLERDGLSVKLTFKDHRIESAKVDSRTIIHLKGEKDPYDQPITERQHGEHYVQLVQQLF
ncbi:hypothetical protein GCM10009007_15840 [Formosimonas limnophila]|uniref:CRISPR-associated endoribonuclease Cas13a n=1 Tax=Formosimonas limnophila TaxID=1384487 RepID=A0A8J3CHV1_9BURK|nr:hypothetical protein GCM10009007_15840 [Formosimonas limnophila]